MKKEFLITKEEFVSYIQFIFEQNKKQNQFLEALDVLADGQEYCNCFLYNSYENKLYSLLRKLTYDKYDDIGYFLYEYHSDFGPVDSDDNVLYSDANTLYDYLLNNYNKE